MSLDQELINAVRKLILKAYGKTGGDFPAPTPSSLMRSDLEQLRRDPYWVVEKTNGTRCTSGMMMMTFKDAACSYDGPQGSETGRLHGQQVIQTCPVRDDVAQVCI